MEEHQGESMYNAQQMPQQPDYAQMQNAQFGQQYANQQFMQNQQNMSPLSSAMYLGAMNANMAYANAAAKSQATDAQAAYVKASMRPKTASAKVGDKVAKARQVNALLLAAVWTLFVLAFVYQAVK